MDHALGGRFIEPLGGQVVFFAQFFDGAVDSRQKGLNFGLDVLPHGAPRRRRSLTISGLNVPIPPPRIQGIPW